jgi:hypothetical protein
VINPDKYGTVNEAEDGSQDSEGEKKIEETAEYSLSMKIRIFEEINDEEDCEDDDGDSDYEEDSGESFNSPQVELCKCRGSESPELIEMEVALSALHYLLPIPISEPSEIITENE